MIRLCRPSTTFFWTFILVIAGGSVRADQFEVQLRPDVMIPMRDGVRLATDVYLPARNGQAVAGKWPTILMRTPYGKQNEGDGRYFAARGYAVVFQDTRGRFRSEGVWHMLTDDGRDGVDTCAWIAKQPWSNAKVGTIGSSYVGGTQHAIALERAPELATAIPIDAMSNLGHASMRNGGAFELRFWNWILFHHRAERESAGTRSGDGQHAQGDDDESPVLPDEPSPAPRNDASQIHSRV